MSADPAIVIIGGGPAGAAAAITLARAGLRPLLLERSDQPIEKVCGEFLGADAAAALAVLGLDVARLGGLPLLRARFAAGRHSAGFALPFAAWSLPRASLDAALLRRAQGAGATVRFGCSVVAASRQAEGWLLRLADGTTLPAPCVVLATGKHELRGLARRVDGGSVGLKLPLGGVTLGADIAVLACAGGYAGLQPRAGGGANLCLALAPRAPALAAAARDPAALIALVAAGSDLAGGLLAGAWPLQARPLTIAGVPYGFTQREDDGAGLFRVGDQAAVIPSLCGDGIAMALLSGMRAAEAILAQDDGRRFRAAWAAAVRPGMRVAGLIDLAMARAPAALVATTGWLPAAAAWAARRTRIGPFPAGRRLGA
jgi:glycine/D-amino acid oxidase-like deaminating enzyme